MQLESGTITATGADNGVSQSLDGYGPASMGVVAVSGTFTGITLVAEKKLRGGAVWLPLVMTDEKTLTRTSGSAPPTDSTTTSYRVDLGGAGSWRVYVSAGTATDVDVELASGAVEEFGGILPAVYTAVAEDTTFSAGVTLPDAIDLTLGTGDDAILRWSTGDASNHALSLGLGDSNQALHVTDKAAIATDWNVSADTHPTVYVHSNTTPATDYMTFGAHDGTTGHVNVVGGTTLSLDISGTAEVTVVGAGLNVLDGNRLFVGVAAVPGTQAGANWIGLEDSTTDPTGTLTNSLAIYTPDAGDSLDFLHADGSTDSLGT